MHPESFGPGAKKDEEAALEQGHGFTPRRTDARTQSVHQLPGLCVRSCALRIAK
jgi:hypothetical protein